MKRNYLIIQTIGRLFNIFGIIVAIITIVFFIFIFSSEIILGIITYRSSIIYGTGDSGSWLIAGILAPIFLGTISLFCGGIISLILFVIGKLCDLYIKKENNRII
jgi:hypothetical protein